MAGDVRYTASSLDDIAAALEGMAELSKKEQAVEKTKVMANFRAGEASAYAFAAKMLRSTRIAA